MTGFRGMGSCLPVSRRNTAPFHVRQTTAGGMAGFPFAVLTLLKQAPSLEQVVISGRPERPFKAPVSYALRFSPM